MALNPIFDAEKNDRSFLRYQSDSENPGLHSESLGE
jgi:hypothetical protein